MIEYFKDSFVEEKVKELTIKLNLTHIDVTRLICVRSRGSKSRHVLARVHTLPRIMQEALGIQAHYFIEVISENFDKLPETEKTKTLIHELLHIPKSFAGGFRHHRLHVNKKAVEKMYNIYLNSKK